MIRDVELLNSAKSGPLRKGRRWLIKYLEGGKISRTQAVQAHCYDCSGMGEHSKCEQESCALYPYSPYKTVVLAKKGA
jgi:hypothetical protein